MFCFYTLRTYKVIHLISKEALLLIYNADNDAGHPLSGIIPSFAGSTVHQQSDLVSRRGFTFFKFSAS